LNRYANSIWILRLIGGNYVLMPFSTGLKDLQWLNYCSAVTFLPETIVYYEQIASLPFTFIFTLVVFFSLFS
jgi:hypothetical protein